MRDGRGDGKFTFVQDLLLYCAQMNMDLNNVAFFDRDICMAVESYSLISTNDAV